jgi:hypothetical protein
VAKRNDLFAVPQDDSLRVPRQNDLVRGSRPEEKRHASPNNSRTYLAALFAISSEMARADEQVVIVARVYPTPAVSTPPVIAAKREIQKSQS